MELKELVFSNDLKHRVVRHLSFWMSRFFVLVVEGEGAMMFQGEGLKKIIQWDVMTAVTTIPPQLPFCYFILYFLMPAFILRKKYVLGITIFIVSILILYWMIYAYVLWTSPAHWACYLLPSQLPTEQLSFAVRWSMFAPSGPLVACSLMCALKFLKISYIKQQENTDLVQENSKAELQLLKAQVHPHFLFNTLNNIYSFTITKSPMASDLVDKLFGILQYMILEGRNTWVPLKKEIKLIQNYISLERVRYGDRLNISVDVKGDVESKFIAPLLMIPFVENSFKHGTSKMLAHPKVELSIIIEGPQLIFRLCNNKPNSNIQEHQSNKGGIGLKNTAKRLQLLYPDKHNLKIEATDTSFSICMNITLKEMKDVNFKKYPTSPTQPTPSYASP